MQLNLDFKKHNYTAQNSTALTSFSEVRFLLDCVLGVSSKGPSSLFWDFVLDLAEVNISYTAQNNKSVSRLIQLNIISESQEFTKKG